MFTHVVLFWNKPDAPAHAQQQIIDDARRLLGAIPNVVTLRAGPTAGTPRDVVDNSYSVGLLVVLTDSAAHDVYQTHPLHLEFIARNKPFWARVQVYDFVG